MTWALERIRAFRIFDLGSPTSGSGLSSGRCPSTLTHVGLSGHGKVCKPFGGLSRLTTISREGAMSILPTCFRKSRVGTASLLCDAALAGAVSNFTRVASVRSQSSTGELSAWSRRECHSEGKDVPDQSKSCAAPRLSLHMNSHQGNSKRGNPYLAHTPTVQPGHADQWSSDPSPPAVSLSGKLRHLCQ